MSAAAIDQARAVRVRYDRRHMLNRWVALAIIFVTRTSMGFQFQAVAAVAPLMVADWFAGREMSTAMGIMLTSWPVGLGIATATLGALATYTSWRTAIVASALVAALGLVLIAFVYRDPPETAGRAVERRARLSGRELGLATSGGFAWGCFNASLVAIIAFGPGLLMA